MRARKDWSVHYYTEEPVAPRDDVNSPDLYIPSMAFVTYVLVCGFLLGTRNDFSPEKLGIQASSAAAWLLMEVLLILMALYLLNITCNLGFFHLLAFASYKFVPSVSLSLHLRLQLHLPSSPSPSLPRLSALSHHLIRFSFFFFFSCFLSLSLSLSLAAAPAVQNDCCADRQLRH